jgi:hypothetical protein
MENAYTAAHRSINREGRILLCGRNKTHRANFVMRLTIAYIRVCAFLRSRFIMIIIRRRTYTAEIMTESQTTRIKPIISEKCAVYKLSRRAASHVSCTHITLYYTTSVCRAKLGQIRLIYYYYYYYYYIILYNTISRQ